MFTLYRTIWWGRSVAHLGCEPDAMLLTVGKKCIFIFTYSFLNCIAFDVKNHLKRLYPHFCQLFFKLLKIACDTLCGIYLYFLITRGKL